MDVEKKKCLQKSFPRLPAVAVAAEHLAVLGDGATAFMPRRDVVGLHLFDFKVLSTELQHVKKANSLFQVSYVTRSVFIPLKKRLQRLDTIWIQI